MCSIFISLSSSAIYAVNAPTGVISGLRMIVIFFFDSLISGSLILYFGMRFSISFTGAFLLPGMSYRI